MLDLIVKFEDARGVVNSESVDVFGNLDQAGIASGAIDETRRLNGAPIALFPGAADAAKWGEDPHGAGPWGGVTGVPAVEFRTPPIHFGRVELGAKARDSEGNYQAGAMLTAERVVNSTPLPPTRLERGDWDSDTEQQVFRFDQSPQLKR